MIEKENTPTGPIVDQFPKYRFYQSVEELNNGCDPSFWCFKQMFDAYTKEADKEGKKHPFISIIHAPKSDGGVNNFFVVNTIEELEKALVYCPWNSSVCIGYYTTFGANI